MKKGLLLLVLIIFVLQSCASSGEILYFQDSNLNNLERINYESSEIQPNDILNITVDALVKETTLPYNKQVASTNPNISLELLKLQGYLVTIEGTILFPVLGKIEVATKSVSEVEIEIAELLESGGHLRKPSVSVRVLNAKVTVLGEVKNPGTFSFTEQNITLPQALGYAGDLTINGIRDDVMLIRHEDGMRRIFHIDMTSTNWFNRPEYFIQPNDVIIVNPNSAKVTSAGIVGNVGTVLTIVSLILTSVVLITR